MTSSNEEIFDSLIIGAGPAGLSAGLYLARLDRKVALFDTEHGRSTWHQVNHNFLGFPGGVPARHLRELGREQLNEYPHVTVFEYKVHELSKQEELFVARGQAREWRGRTVIICTGVVDQYPHFDGWEEYVGRSMHWCLVCDGYETKGKRVLVVGNCNAAVLEALQLTRFTNRIAMLTNSQECIITEDYKERLARANIPLLHDKIERVIGKEGQLEALYTRGGECIELDKIFSCRNHVPQTKLARDIGLVLDDEGYIITDYEQKTNVPGAYAAGDVTLIFGHQIGTAVHEGSQAALTANYYLYPAELK
jgi:thioredoxin reductase (NADPH)